MIAEGLNQHILFISILLQYDSRCLIFDKVMNLLSVPICSYNVQLRQNRSDKMEWLVNDLKPFRKTISKKSANNFQPFLSISWIKLEENPGIVLV